MNLSINVETCIRCGKCVKACPSRIFTQDQAEQLIHLVNPESCIICGHCVATCPTSSVEHSEFPAETVHPIDYTLYPTAEQMMLLCKGRRSNRAFSKQAIPAELLTQILEAAHRAPTASNLQQIGFTLVTDPAKLNVISHFTIGTFGAILKKVDNPILKPLITRFVPGIAKYIPTFKRIQREYSAGNDLILRKATAVILIHTPAKSRFGIEDANLAYQNGSLMAECLGVSQFYTGFVLSATKQNHGELEKILGIDGVIRAGMALGMPQFRYPNYIDKKGIILDVQS